MADNNKKERQAPAAREGGTERVMGRGRSCGSGIKNKSERVRTAWAGDAGGARGARGCRDFGAQM